MLTLIIFKLYPYFYPSRNFKYFRKTNAYRLTKYLSQDNLLLLHNALATKPSMRSLNG